MKKKYRLIFIAGALLQISCSFRGFRPPPYDFEEWKMPGASVHVQQVMAAMLECGYPWPDANTDQLIQAWGLDWVPSSVLADRCMESQGFIRDFGSSRKCDHGLAPQFRKYRTPEQLQALEHACDPNTPAPEPSVEKRLNSPYCKVKEYRQYPQCQPVVVPSSQPKGKASKPVVVPQYPVTDRVTPQVQKDSNAQMNQLLQDTNNRK